MTVWRATKTLAAINAALAADDGNAWRGWLGRVLPHIGDAYRDNEDAYRTHLGASVIGGECERAIGFSWRWALKRPPRGKKDEPPVFAHARMVRLWNRGHMEEGRFIALMLVAGITIYQQDAEGKQFRISEFGGHFGGACDGVGMGIPDLPPGIPGLTEYKTHSDDSFKELEDEGLRIAKPTHFVQMQKYMGKLGLLYGLYLAVNKNNDMLYAEIIQYDGDVDKRFTERARKIIFERKLPPRVRNASPGFRLCKYMCDFPDVCFHTVKPDRHCRTCAFWYAMPDGTHQCVNPVVTNGGAWLIHLTKEDQIRGCSHYEIDPELK